MSEGGKSEFGIKMADRGSLTGRREGKRRIVCKIGDQPYRITREIVQVSRTHCLRKLGRRRRGEGSLIHIGELDRFAVPEHLLVNKLAEDLEAFLVPDLEHVLIDRLAG